MDVKAYLMTQGLSDADAQVIASNPAYASAYEKLAKQAEDGTTAYQKAQEIEQSMKTWNETQVVPYVQKADARVAKLEAELAGRNAHMKALKELGYDIPESYLTPTPGETNVTPLVAAKPDKNYDDLLHQSSRANMELISLSEKARDLLGHGLDVSQEYDEFGKQARPNETLRTYITRKYDLDTLSKKRDDDKKTAYEKAIADKAAAEAVAAYQAKHGSNGDTRTPVSSKFDRVNEERSTSGQDKDGRPLWQTAAGREEATKRRVQKYINSGLVS